jgi:glycosyltransferase involved in cell wall biosynthesis
MKILQALFFPPEQPGGVSSMVPDIVDRFNKKGWEMELFSLPIRIRNKGTEQCSFATFDWRVYQGDPIVEKYMQTYRDYMWWTKLKVNQSFDLIHAHHPIAALVMKQIFPNTPLLVTIHSSYENELILNGELDIHSPGYEFLISLYREIQFAADLVITASQSFKQYIGQHIENAEKILVIPNGFDERRFRPIPHDNQIPQLISVCRLVPAKGLDTLILACAELKKRNHPFVLHLIGDGPSREYLANLAIEHGVYEETIFYGYMLHPEEFMPFFDIFVLPSRAEAFGSVFAEAALCWLALVGTEVGGIAEQIEHGVNGMLVPADDADALSYALEKLIQDPDFRYQLARAAGEKAKKNYSMNRMIQHMKVVYESYLLKEKG